MWENYVKIHLKKLDIGMWIIFVCIRTGTSCASLFKTLKKSSFLGCGAMYYCNYRSLNIRRSENTLMKFGHRKKTGIC
jgi:hypothetical protein